jgi:hypothetical protein
LLLTVVQLLSSGSTGFSGTLFQERPNTRRDV